MAEAGAAGLGFVLAKAGLTPATFTAGAAAAGALAGAGIEVLVTTGGTQIVRLTEAALAAWNAGTVAAADVGLVAAGTGVSVAGSNAFKTVSSAASTASKGATGGVTGGTVGAVAGAEAGKLALKKGAGVMSKVALVGRAGSGVLGVGIGGLEMGLAISELVNGSATQNTVIDFYAALGKIEKSRLNASEHAALNRALSDTATLVADVKTYVEGINASKITGGAATTIGGGLCIGAIFFPPLLIPGLITTGVGVTTAVTNLIIDLSVTHKDRLVKIIEKLREAGLYVLFNDDKK